MKLNRFFQHLALVALIVAGFTGTVIAAGSPSNTSGSKSSSAPTENKINIGGGSVQGYASDSLLQVGTIVQLSGSNKVAAATYKDLQQMYGVVVDPHLQQLTLSDTSLKNEAFVATSGTYQVLVSTEGGAIKSGDYVTMSDINGVGMKATPDQKTVFGRSVSNFDGKTNSLGSVTLKTTAGSVSQSVQIGVVSVVINVQHNPEEKSTKANVPHWLQALGLAVAQKPVGPLRIYLSIGITGLSIIVALTTLYSGIRNSVISIGRNPLSKKSIFRGLLEIILTSFLILIIGLFAVYLLLKL